MSHLLALPLNHLVIKWAYKVYKNKEFLTLIKLKQAEELEKFRILNELLFAGELLAMAILKFHKKADVENQFLKAHLAFLRDLGVEEKNRKLWKRASFKRFKELENINNEVRMAMIEFEGKGGYVDCYKMDEINFLLPQFTVATLCNEHLGLRGKESHDRMFKFIVQHLTDLALDIHMKICEDRFGTSGKVKVKILSLWEGLRKN